MLIRTDPGFGGPWPAPESAAPKALEFIDAVAGPELVLAVSAVLAAVLIATSVRYRRGRTLLKERDEIQLLPSNSFDPTPEDILRFAAQIGRTRRTLGWLVPRRARAVRIRLALNGEGQLGYWLSGSRRAGSVLRQGTYPQVELLTADAERAPGGGAAA